MDDELQRRLRAADPLTAGDGLTRTPAQLEKLKEFALMETKRRSAATPRLVGTAALTALAGVIFFGGFVGPQKTLAFSPVPTAVTSPQLAAADAACRAPVEGYPDYPVPFAGSTLINLELFGNGGVAIYSNGVTTGACMVLIDGETAVAGIRADQVSSKEFINTGGSTEFAGQRVSMLTGVTPAGAVRVDVEGIDGAYATVVDGLYGLWLPQEVFGQNLELVLVARDESGNELKRQAISW